MRKLYICCDEKQREKLTTRAKEAFTPSVSVVDDYSKADIAYVIGDVTPTMEKQIEAMKKTNINVVKVNENFINEDLYNKLWQGKIKVHRSTERERE